MQRLSTLIILATTVVLTAPSTAAAAHHRPKSKCPAIHSRAVAASSEAEAYLGPEPNNPEVFVFYACAYGSSRVYELGPQPVGSSSGFGGVAHIAVAGTCVAYEVERGTTQGVFFASDIVIVRELRSGRILHKVPTGPSEPPERVGKGPTTAVVVKSDGAVAWIVRTGIAPSTYEVRAVDKTGERLVAAGTNIDPASLALAGSTLYWTQEGRPMSAQLN